MSAFKLVVVSPFESYKRGDYITDPVIVENILNTSHDMHHCETFVRRISLSNAEKEMLIARSNPVMSSPAIDNKIEESTIQIESVADGF